MHDAVTRRWKGRTWAAAAATGMALACAAPATAATSIYPAGAGTFDADAQGWIGSDARCSMTSGVSVLCGSSTAYDAAGGSPGGALATNVDVTVNVLGLFAGSAVWTSPSFTIPTDADVTSATLALDAAFAPGGLLNLGMASEIELTLADLTDAGTTSLTTVQLDDGDTAFASHGGALPSGAIEAGHSYRLVATTSTTSSLSSVGLLGRASTLVDNVALNVTTAAPATGGDSGSGSGGTGGGGAIATTAGDSGTGAADAGGRQPPARPMTRRALWRLLRSLDLGAQTGPHAGGSLVPRSRCTIVGTRRADRLVGTRGIDVICGLGGNDVIVGRGGADLIDGGNGRDRIGGGGASDVLLGLRGGDRLRGAAGRDVLAGGAGRDLLQGGVGIDSLLGGAGRDVARGGLRHDAAAGVERRLR